MTVAAVGLLDGLHKHHVVPRHLGGTDDPSNLVLLHPYDHAIAHFVRWKMYGTHGDAWAYNRLKRWLDEGGLTVSGMRHSEDAKKKIGEASANRARKPHTKETRAKISDAKKGKSSNRLGVKHSEESINKMRQSHLGQVAWNKGLKGVQVAWNKGKNGVQQAWNKGISGQVKWSEDAKQKQSERIKQVWAKRRGEAT